MAIYVLVCIFFVLAALFEFAFLLAKRRLTLMRKHRNQIQAFENDGLKEAWDSNATNHKAEEIKAIHWECMFDQAAFIVFLVSFATFVLGYFIKYSSF